MPYIDQNGRNKLLNYNKILDETEKAETSGELNYLITLLVKDFIKRKGKSYATLNEVVGVLECVKLELYRRQVASYEDTKIESNGDVY